MTDRHGIGRAMERTAMDHAARNGYHACWQPPRGKFTSQDIWGVYDFLMLNERGDPVGVQVCLDRPQWVQERTAVIQAWRRETHAALPSYVLAYKRRRVNGVPIIVWHWYPC